MEYRKGQYSFMVKVRNMTGMHNYKEFVVKIESEILDTPYIDVVKTAYNADVDHEVKKSIEYSINKIIDDYKRQ